MRSSIGVRTARHASTCKHDARRRLWYFPWLITELVSILSIRSVSLVFSSGFTPVMNTPGPELASLFVSESWKGIMGGSGSNPNPDGAQPSYSASPSDDAQSRPNILVIEDNKADLFLIREAIEGAQLGAEVQVIHDGEAAVEYFE